VNFGNIVVVSLNYLLQMTEVWGRR